MGSLPAGSRFRVDNLCIIGGGPSGLACAKYLSAENFFSRITVFEQRAKVGGIWNHVPCEANAEKELCIPQSYPSGDLNKPLWQHASDRKESGHGAEYPAFLTPLYDELETNIPKSLMGFSDLDWPEDCQLFPKHEEVLRYLEQYAEEVLHLISFNTQVIEVREIAGGRWLVKTQSMIPRGNASVREEIFDAVIVANGHYNTPYVPAVPGIEEWNKAYPGAISHSKYYRKPAKYANKKVIIVGNSASGIDIGRGIATVCQLPLIQSQKSDSYLLTTQPPNQRIKPEIKEYIVEDRTVKFTDDTYESNVDRVLYCTGYFYSFPFIRSLEPPLISSGERVTNTYQHIFYRRNPSLALLVLNQKVIPFPLAEVQSAVVARVFAGRITLPSEAEMKDWEQKVVKEMGSGRSFHVLSFPKDANYINMLHDWATTADEGTSEGGAAVGKTPPFWGEKEYWTRERFPAIKKAFQDYGEERHQKRTLEDVGYCFEDWKKEQT